MERDIGRDLDVPDYLSLAIYLDQQRRRSISNCAVRYRDEIWGSDIDIELHSSHSAIAWEFRKAVWVGHFVELPKHQRRKWRCDPLVKKHGIPRVAYVDVIGTIVHPH